MADQSIEVSQTFLFRTVQGWPMAVTLEGKTHVLLFESVEDAIYEATLKGLEGEPLPLSGKDGSDLFIRSLEGGNALAVVKDRFAHPVTRITSAEVPNG